MCRVLRVACVCHVTCSVSVMLWCVISMPYPSSVFIGFRDRTAVQPCNPLTHVYESMSGGVANGTSKIADILQNILLKRKS